MERNKKVQGRRSFLCLWARTSGSANLIEYKTLLYTLQWHSTRKNWPKKKEIKVKIERRNIQFDRIENIERKTRDEIYIFKSCPVVNIRRRLNRKKKGNKIGARFDHILYLLASILLLYGMEWRKEERITITHLQKMMARMMISFGLAIFLHGYSHLKRENNKKRQNRQGWREAQPLPIKNRRPHLSALALSLYLCACQLSVYYWPLSVFLFFEVFIIYNDRNIYIIYRR